MNLIESVRLSQLPGYGKVFVGLFTALMMMVCLWVMIIYTVEEGFIADGVDPLAYMKEEPTENVTVEQQLDIEEIVSDSESVLAPIWDNEQAGEEQHLDPAVIEKKLRAEIQPGDESRDLEKSDDGEEESGREQLEDNIGLAHTHINGQTLLFFALGLIFIFTSAKPKVKKSVLWIFAVAIVCHAVGLSGQHFHWFFDDILAVSGLAIVICIIFMSYWIFIDLGKSGREQKS